MAIGLFTNSRLLLGLDPQPRRGPDRVACGCLTTFKKKDWRGIREEEKENEEEEKMAFAYCEVGVAMKEEVKSRRRENGR